MQGAGGQGRRGHSLDTRSLEAHAPSVRGAGPCPAGRRETGGQGPAGGTLVRVAVGAGPCPRGWTPEPRVPSSKWSHVAAPPGRAAAQAVGYPEFGGTAGAPPAVRSRPDARRPDWPPGLNASSEETRTVARGGSAGAPGAGGRGEEGPGPDTPSASPGPSRRTSIFPSLPRGGADGISAGDHARLKRAY